MGTRRVTLQWSSKRWSLIYWGHWTINKSCNLFVRKVGPLRKILHQISKGKKCDRAKVSEKPSGCCEPLLLLLQAMYVTSSILHLVSKFSSILAWFRTINWNKFWNPVWNSLIWWRSKINDRATDFLYNNAEGETSEDLIAELLNHANKSDIRDGPHKP